MANLKEKFSKDFEQSNPKELSFNVEQLEDNTWKQRHKTKPSRIVALSICSTLVGAVVVLSISVINALPKASSFQEYNKRYTINEINIAESNTFQKLKSVNYPNAYLPTSSVISEQEEQAYGNFSNLTYHSLVNTSKEDNMSYSTVGLYSILNELEGAVSRDSLKERFNNLLGLTDTQRVAFYNKVIQANSYVNGDGTTQIKNAAFFTNKFNYSSDYVDSLSKLYCESYEADLLKDTSKIANWVNEAVNSKDFIDNNFLDLNEKTAFVFLSTLYFKNTWENKYVASKNVKDKFYLNGTETVTTTFMKHSYTTKQYYDYGSYISVKDTYKTGDVTITYIVPKDYHDSIYDLTKSTNIFKENESCKVSSEDQKYIIYLKTPKFSLKSDVDLIQSMSNLGFSDMFSDQVDSFSKAFDDPLLNGDDYFTFLQQLKQRNEVEFNENGTEVKSVTMAAGGATATGMETIKTLNVDLDRPFIYIIRDCNDTPIFVGHVDNPTLK